MRLNDILSKQKNLSIPVDDSAVNVNYRVHFMNNAVEAAINAVKESDTKVRDLFGVFCDVVISWDLTDDNGIPLPLNADSLASMGVPSDVAVHILNACMEDASNVGETNSAS